MRPPVFAVVRFRRARSRRRISLWLPLFLVWILLLPLVLIVLPIAVVAMIVAGMKPLRTLGGMLRLLCGVTGTAIEVDSPKAFVSIGIL